MDLESVITAPWFKDVLVIVITLVGAYLILKWITYSLNKSKEKWDIDPTLIQVTDEIIKYSIYVIAIIIILNELGFNLTALALSLGIVGIAVGFGARDTISNFISGIFILADKTVRVGDVIEISDQVGKVTKLGFRTTTLLTYDERLIKVPNSIFSSNPYINYTASETRRVELDITIPYDFDLDKTVEAIEDVASSSDKILKKPNPKIIVKELSEQGVKIVLWFWINDPWNVVTLKSAVAKDVNRILDEIRSKK